MVGAKPEAARSGKEDGVGFVLIGNRRQNAGRQGQVFAEGKAVGKPRLVVPKSHAPRRVIVVGQCQPTDRHRSVFSGEANVDDLRHGQSPDLLRMRLGSDSCSKA